MRLPVLPSIALAAFAGLAATAAASPQFTQMNVALNTADHAKAPDTRVEISILPDSGGDPVAYLDVAPKEFPANATDNEVVPRAGTGFEEADLARHYILVRATPSQPGVWRLTLDAILQFDDGSQALVGSGRLTLSSSNPQAIVPLSLATVAHPGVIGSVERFGFRLLSKNTAPAAPGPAVSRLPHKSPREFTHMDLTFETGAKGEDASAKIEVSVVPRSGGPAVAYLAIEGQTFYPYHKQSVVVPPLGDGFTLESLKDHEIQVRVTTRGYGTWTTKYDAILHFADGSTAMIGSGDLALSSASDHQSLSLSAAAVAGTGMLGRIERFGFGVVSKGAVHATEEPVPQPPAGSAAPGSVAAQAPARAAAPSAPDAFTGMDVKLWSGSLGKNAATRVEISIEPGDGGPVAFLDIPDRSIAPGTSAELTVPPANGGFTRSELKGKHIVLRITPSGHVNWTHGLDVVLHFADGSAALWSTGDLALTDYRTEESISLAEATVVSHGFVGGLAKMGFGLLNHIGSK